LTRLIFTINVIYTDLNQWHDLPPVELLVEAERLIKGDKVGAPRVGLAKKDLLPLCVPVELPAVLVLHGLRQPADLWRLAAL
jgi:hypothetical protein